MTMDLAKSAGVGLLGMAAGRTVSNMIPFGGTDPLMNFAKGTAVAIGIRVFGEKVLGRDMARMAAVGAMLGPTKDLVTHFLPSASTFLGAGSGYAVMSMPRIPVARTISSYAGSGEHASLGSYAYGDGNG